jgi:hypothetical protein
MEILTTVPPYVWLALCFMSFCVMVTAICIAKVGRRETIQEAGKLLQEADKLIDKIGNVLRPPISSGMIKEETEKGKRQVRAAKRQGDLHRDNSPRARK